MKFINNILQNPVVKITSINSLSVIIRIITGLVSTSIVAKFLGPSGVALLGNLRNFVTSLETISTLGFNNGIIKHVAENQKNQDELKRIISTVFWSLLLISVCTGLILFTFSEYWNFLIFGSESNYSIIFNIAAFTIPLHALNVFIISIINGLSEYKKVIQINIIANIIGFLISIFLIIKHNIFGALLGLIIIPGLLFIITWIKTLRTINLKYYIQKSIDFKVLRNLSSYTLMAFVSAFCLPIIHLQIRNQAIINLGIETAGNWEAMNRLSVFYMMFVSTILSVYFFPKLSQASTNCQTQEIFKEYYKTIIPLFIFGGIVLYFLRDWLILLIYSDKFTSLSDLFLWQLIGDFFKVSSMILGYQFFAKKLTKLFLLTEVLSISILYFSSNYLMKIIGVEGLVKAHALTYFIYLLVLLILFRKIVFRKHLK